MKFTLDFLELFFYGIYLAAPLLLTLIFVIILLGHRVGKKEKWPFYDALYWAFITATTVGYGDMKPTRKISKALAVVIAFTGLIFTGIIVAIALQSAAKAFEEQYTINTLKTSGEKPGTSDEKLSLPGV